MTRPSSLLRVEEGSLVVPGDRLTSKIVVRNEVSLISGPGTYVKGGGLWASLIGQLTVRPSAVQPPAANRTVPVSYIISVEPLLGKRVASSSVLSVGQVILGKILRIQLQQAIVEIHAAAARSSSEAGREGTETRNCLLLKYPVEGAIRREDVRTGASADAHLIKDAFRPGDVVVAKVVAVGDSRRYFLSTTTPELGVIHALSIISGLPMTPVDSSGGKEMICPSTGSKEPRKCASPFVANRVLASASDKEPLQDVNKDAKEDAIDRMEEESHL